MNVKNIALCYVAGTVGGFANSVVLWLSGMLGITAALGVKLAPAFTAAWLYPRLVWGGLWGFLFLLPFLVDRLYLKGLLLSLAPSAVQLFFIFPEVVDKGILGLSLGTLTPAFVLLFNAIWGLTTAGLLVRLNGSQ